MTQTFEGFTKGKS